MPRLSCALLTLGLFSVAEATQARPLASADYRRLRSVAEARISPDSTRIVYAVSTNDGPGRPRKQLFVLTLADGRSARIGGDEPASDPEWSPDGRWLAWSGAVDGKKGLIVAHPDGSGLRFLGEISGTNSPLTFEGRRHRLVARRHAHRLRVRDPGPRDRARQRGSGRDHTLPLQARRRRGDDALQRQPAAPHLRRRSRHGCRLAAHARGPRGALDRLVAGRARDRLRVERGTRPRPLLQPRPVRDSRGRRGRPQAHRHRERRVPAALVAGRQEPRVPGHAPRAHRPRDHDGGHPRVADGRGRQRAARAGGGRGQPTGRGQLVARRPVDLLHRPGARARAAGRTAARRGAR